MHSKTLIDLATAVSLTSRTFALGDGKTLSIQATYGNIQGAITIESSNDELAWGVSAATPDFPAIAGAPGVLRTEFVEFDAYSRCYRVVFALSDGTGPLRVTAVTK